MRSDIDRLMTDLNLDTIIVIGDESPNPYRDYLTNRAKATGTIIKKRGQAAIFVVNAMERDEAAKSGFQVYTQYDLGLGDLMRRFAGSDSRVLDRELYANYFDRFQIGGRVAFYGVADVGDSLAIVLSLRDRLRERQPGVEFVFDGDSARLFSTLYETKDAQEIVHLKEAARLTGEVVRRTWDFIHDHRAASREIGTAITDGQGEALTIGHVKRFIRQQENLLGLEDPEGCIFAQGRDAGLPHSTGNDQDVLLVGSSIVFDIFPREAGGYFHDMTRTWCIGQAPGDVLTAYEQTREIFDKAKGALKVGEFSGKYQEMTLNYYESKGHPTQRTQPGTLEGYVHSLGHGVGLNVHEAPSLSVISRGSYLAPGNVFTVEPGLYYPDRGYGVRIEDTVYFDPQGKLHTLTDFPYDLVIPLHGM